MSLAQSDRPKPEAKAAMGCACPVPEAGASDDPVNQLLNHSGVLSGGKE